jgi:serine/threonine protein kinase
MLDDEMHVKVADFGLSRDIYERDYYSCDNRRNKLPVKWMALESLEKGIYNSRTDVWSFGIVLWELMTRGVCPYPDVDNWDIIKFLKHGRRLPQPPYCPEALYDVMQRCWLVDAWKRPTFDRLVSQITEILGTMLRSRQTGGSTGSAVHCRTSYNPDNHVVVPAVDYLEPCGSSSECQKQLTTTATTECCRNQNCDDDCSSLSDISCNTDVFLSDGSLQLTAVDSTSIGRGSGWFQLSNIETLRTRCRQDTELSSDLGIGRTPRLEHCYASPSQIMELDAGLSPLHYTSV